MSLVLGKLTRGALQFNCWCVDIYICIRRRRQRRRTRAVFFSSQTRPVLPVPTFAPLDAVIRPVRHHPHPSHFRILRTTGGSSVHHNKTDPAARYIAHGTTILVFVHRPSPPRQLSHTRHCCARAMHDRNGFDRSIPASSLPSSKARLHESPIVARSRWPVFPGPRQGPVAVTNNKQRTAISSNPNSAAAVGPPVLCSPRSTVMYAGLLRDSAPHLFHHAYYKERKKTLLFQPRSCCRFWTFDPLSIFGSSIKAKKDPNSGVLCASINASPT
jgi:hypothetical protein